ncbi:glycosyltransferase family 1 protein [Paenibacillus agilis]|uniref:Glycosyltransferase family 1 protein n=1 Tax=Paenibacillus agilis TaxID=3020863 RepID=A0A559J135_9BACL|nr:glycosyltransferase family 1 protein [Paenibacillus agilis]TVX93604.1 glycosyltransferase family 1 protein [Paenibacillus agilis]
MNKELKRVLHVIPSTGFGGITSMVMNLYRALDKERVQFDFASFNRGHLHDDILSMGGRVFYFDYMKKQGIFRYMHALKKLIHEQGPYHAIHVHNGYKGGFALLAARMAGIDTRICHIHTSNVEERWQKAILPLLKSVSIGQATELIACGQDAGTFMYGERSFSILMNAIQPEQYANRSPWEREQLRRELNIPSDCLVIGHVGRLSPVKNHHFMLEIAEQLKNHHTNVPFRFVFVGDGPLHSELEETIHKKGLEKYVFMIGSREDIPALMNVFDLYLLPSHFEGLPVTLLEAQAAAIPCLVSTGVTRESDIGAEMVTFMDLSAGAQAWAYELLNCIDRGQGNQQEAGAKLTERGYDVNSSLTRLLQIYNV